MVILTIIRFMKRPLRVDLQLCRTYRVVSSVVTCHVPSCSAQLIVRLCQLSVPSCLSSVTAPAGQSHSQSRTIWLLQCESLVANFTSREISGNLQTTEIESAWVLGSISQEIVFRRFRSAISTPVSWESRLGGLHFFTCRRTTTSSKTFVDSTVFVYSWFSNDYVYETYLTIIIILVWFKRVVSRKCCH